MKIQSPLSSFKLPLIIQAIILVFLIYGCENTPDKKSELEKAGIHQRIQEDISNGISDIPTLTLNEPDLPKTKYLADKAHSSISFRTKHWEIVDLIGWFSEFDVVMYADSADFTDAVIFAQVNPKSAQMPETRMAGTIQRAPYIDSENHEFMTFKSQELKKLRGNNYILTGVMQMNGLEKETTFDVVFNGFAYPGEKSICGFDVTGKINRKDFNVAGGDDTIHSGRKVHDDIIHLRMSLRME